MSEAPAILELDRVAYGFPERPAFLPPISARFERGECCGIVGPNGAGKSTLLRLAAGLKQPASGRVSVDGRCLLDLSDAARARLIAFLPQAPISDLPLPVEDIVLMGRFPHRQFGLFENASDRRIAADAMAMTGVGRFARRELATLSGGEAQRVHLAAALAQQPRVLLLDEPTASLDLHHQLAIFELLRRVAERDDLLVLVVTHDLNLAARFCHRVLLLDDGRLVALGRPGEVLTPAVLEPVYRVTLARASTGDGSLTLLAPRAAVDDGGDTCAL